MNTVVVPCSAGPAASRRKRSGGPGCGAAPRSGEGWFRRQGGQSLVETLVFAMALLPLLLGLVFVTKYQSIRQSSIAASRTIAFDCTVRPESCGRGDAASLKAEVWQRHLADGRTPLASIKGGEPAGLRGNAFWVDRRQQPLIEGMAASHVELAREGADTTARLDDATLGLVGHFGLPLGDDLVQADVRVRVSEGRTLEQWLVRPEGLQLDLGGRTAILVDNWNASEGRGADPRSVETRVTQGSVPPLPGFGEATDLGYLPIRTLIRSPLLAPFEPNGRDFNYHEVDVDIVPDDRLGGTR